MGWVGNGVGTRDGFGLGKYVGLCVASGERVGLFVGSNVGSLVVGLCVASGERVGLNVGDIDHVGLCVASGLRVGCMCVCGVSVCG